ncbi:Arm DNA-binding domain-containing protein [Nocardia sp. NBC_00403]|uniref:Arm DNA-binding domain-containing protein n=1 Tax=Nocardia sp. NBC_00403 TaxID=2975990 RepID=UPI002E1FA1C6
MPSQITEINVTDRRTGKQAVRYQVRADAGVDPQSGKRHQVRHRFRTEKEAHLDTLVAASKQGGTVTEQGRVRRPWVARSLKRTIETTSMVWTMRLNENGCHTA